MAEYSLLILGIVSENTMMRISKGFKKDLDAYCTINLFCSYSEYDIPINAEFNCLINLQTQSAIAIKTTLADITQGWGLPFDFIPKGHKTISRFIVSKFDLKVIEREIPIIDLWESSDNKFELLSSRRDFL